MQNYLPSFFQENLHFSHSDSLMAPSLEEHQLNQNPNTEESIDDEESEDEEYFNNEDDEDEDEEEEEEEVEQPMTRKARLMAEKAKLESLIQRLSNERVLVRVHDVIIKGNTKTKESLLEAEIETLKNATSMQELLHFASLVNVRLASLEIFDAVKITLDSGPPELPGTTNVIVEVVETKNPVTGNIGIKSSPEARSYSLEASLNLKNLLGYGDIWDGSWAYSWDQTSEISTGLALPRFKGLLTPLTARISLHNVDWLKFSSYKERLLGVSIGLISTRYHDLAYNFTWRTLTDPSQRASKSIRSQLGHSLLSSLRYTFKVDTRNSPLRPTQGYAFVSNSQIGGLSPDRRSLHYLRQDFDIRYAFPLGFYNAALNFGASVGAIFPWGSGFMSRPSPLPEKYFLGGNSSPVCSLGGPTTLLGFKSRGVGPTEPRRAIVNSDEESLDTSTERDVLGGDLAVTAFADLSFDLPLNLFRDAGIHGHVFACAGNLTKLSENEFRNFSLRKYGESFRSSAGAGIIIPTKLFRLEINYCYILKQLEHDRGKTGVQFSFSSPV